MMKISSMKTRLLKLLPAFFLTLVFLTPSMQSEAAYCGQKMTTYQAMSPNRADNFAFNNLIYAWFAYPSSKDKCNDDQVYFSRTDFEQYTVLTKEFATAKRDITSLQNGIASLTKDNLTNKADINNLKNEVQALKNSAGSTSQASTPYNYLIAAQFYGLAFSTVVGLWFIASMIAPVITAIRHF